MGSRNGTFRGTSLLGLLQPVVAALLEGHHYCVCCSYRWWGHERQGWHFQKGNTIEPAVATKGGGMSGRGGTFRGTPVLALLQLPRVGHGQQGWQFQRDITIGPAVATRGLLQAMCLSWQQHKEGLSWAAHTLATLVYTELYISVYISQVVLMHSSRV